MKACFDILKQDIKQQWTIANDNSLLLGYNSPSASDVSGLIHIDGIIISINKPKTTHCFRKSCANLSFALCLSNINRFQ